MSSNPLRLKYLFQKYLDNTCSKEDLREFWQLMSQLSEDDLVAIRLQDLWNEPEIRSGTTPVNRSAKWENAYNILQQRVAEQETDYVKFVPGKQQWFRRLAVAACILGCMAVAYFTLYRNDKLPERLAKVNKLLPGQQIIHLSDSTVVTLSSKSRLEYPATFSSSTREVYLTGEAYFNVSHNASKQFIVHSGSILTRVLGTAFNIKAIPGDTKVSITVTRGKVLVQTADTKKTLAVLLPGYQLTVNKDETFYTEKVNVQELKGWKNEHLVFDNVTFAEAAVLVGIHFGIEIKFSNEALRTCRFTGNFNNNTLDDTMDIMCELTNSNWHRDEEKIIWLDGKGCQ